MLNCAIVYSLEYKLIFIQYGFIIAAKHSSHLRTNPDSHLGGTNTLLSISPPHFYEMAW